MPRFSHLAIACALAISAQAAQAQQFSSVVSFGDSLSDAGNTSTVDGNAATLAGNSFTTNNDPVFAQIVAAAFGQNQQHSVIGGSNYAFGGSCAQAAGACVAPTLPRLNVQIGQYLTPRAGVADRNALYTVWSGANDIFAAIGGGVWTTSPAIIAGSSTVAGAVMTNVNTLTNAGARTIVVFNLPDLGRTPQFGASTTTSAPFNLATISYNSALNAGMAGRTNVVPINTFGILNDIIANPATYGFTNVTGIACGPGAPGVVSSAACGAVGSGNPFTYAAGTNNTYLFADGVHPTGAAHRILANVVLATLSAPGQVSLAGEIPVQIYGDHSRAIGQELFNSKAGGLDVGASRGFLNAQFRKNKIDATTNTGALDSKTNTLTGGFEYRYSEGFSFGAAVSVAKANGQLATGDNDGREFLGSAFGSFHFGGGYIDAMASLGKGSVDISRNIVMGAATRKEQGNAGTTHKAFELGAGYLFGTDTVKHGPFANVAWQDVYVRRYSEESSSSTAMRFNGFNRNSLIGRLGYELQGKFGADRVFHPSFRVAYAKESKDDTISVTAGSVSLNGQFTLAGYTPSKDWIEADVGLDFEVTDGINAYVGYHGRLNDQDQSGDAFNLGVSGNF
jgi:outer membrane lipase/esterase